MNKGGAGGGGERARTGAIERGRAESGERKLGGHVFGFDVAVDDADGVEVGDSSHDLGEAVSCF